MREYRVYDTAQKRYVYTYLGNDIRRELCEKFIDSGYDLKVITEGVNK